VNFCKVNATVTLFTDVEKRKKKTFQELRAKKLSSKQMSNDNVKNNPKEWQIGTKRHK
jgi:hypothetical protein